VARVTWSKILLPGSAEKPRRQEGSVVELAGGALFFAWADFDGRSDNDRATIEAMVTADRGETWGQQRTLIENTAGLNVISPAVRRRGAGPRGLV
jgi:hypothetical protein